MNHSGARTRIVPLLIVLGGMCSAAGQQVRYLVPDKFQAQVGDQLQLHVEAGDALRPQRAAWPGQDLRWLFVRVAGTQENRQKDEAQPARSQDDFITWTLVHGGITLIGFDTRPTVTQVAGKELRAFLETYIESSTLPSPRPAVKPTAKINVRRTESTKALVRVEGAGGQGGHSAVAQSKSGQAVEIRPLFDPTMLSVGSDLPVRVYVDGSKKVGVRVRATSVAAGVTESKATDSSGATHFRIAHAGLWRLEFHHAEPLTGDPAAEWAIYSATLTFEVAGEGASK